MAATRKARSNDQLLTEVKRIHKASRRDLEVPSGEQRAIGIAPVLVLHGFWAVRVVVALCYCTKRARSPLGFAIVKVGAYRNRGGRKTFKLEVRL